MPAFKILTPIDEEYLIKRIKANVFIGAFDQDKIVGFAGIHDINNLIFLLSFKSPKKADFCLLLKF